MKPPRKGSDPSDAACGGWAWLQSTSSYALVWAEDAASIANRPPGPGGESVADVADRLLTFIRRLEQAHRGRDIVLVSHGDALSILAAVLLGAPLSSHRQHGLPNAGILRLLPRQAAGLEAGEGA